MGPVPRWVVAVVAVAGLVAAIDVGIIVATRGSAATDSGNGSVAVIDPSSNSVVGKIKVGSEPTAVAVGYGRIWVLNKDEGSVTELDPSGRRLTTLAPDAVVNTMSVGVGGLWLAGPPRGVSVPLEDAKLERVNPSTGVVDRQFDTTTGATAVAAGGGSLWSTGYLGGHVRGAARSDARTGAMQRLDLEIYGDLVTADEKSVYYVATLGKRVARLSAATGLLTNSMTLATDASLAAGFVPPDPTGVVVGGGSIWISQSDGTVLRIDPRLAGIEATIPACDNALAVAYGEGAVWVACGGGTVVRIDPATDRRSATIGVGRLPRGIAAGEGSVWVTLN